MILSTNSDMGEYDIIRKPEHYSRVWEEIEQRLPGYWQAFVKRGSVEEPGRKLAAHFGKQVQQSSAAEVSRKTFAIALENYEKVAEKYHSSFHPEAMEEFADDPGAFKIHLAKEVPVIARTLLQRRPELQQWQGHFRRSRASDLLSVFSNVLDFREEWVVAQPEEHYASHDDPSTFGLDPMDDDTAMSLANVIGMGIKSIVLYHLDPRLFPQRGRFDLYGLYFLSGREDFRLPSKSSEFLMINDVEPASDGSWIMEHNFWYPYGLFSMYALRIFRWLDERVREEGGSGLDVTTRYVAVSCFLSAVCAEHSEDMRVMRAHDRFGVPL